MNQPFLNPKHERMKWDHNRIVDLLHILQWWVVIETFMVACLGLLLIFR